MYELGRLLYMEWQVLHEGDEHTCHMLGQLVGRSYYVAHNRPQTDSFFVNIRVIEPKKS